MEPNFCQTDGSPEGYTVATEMSTGQFSSTSESPEAYSKATFHRYGKTNKIKPLQQMGVDNSGRVWMQIGSLDGPQ